jgi:hypothetical protein
MQSSTQNLASSLGSHGNGWATLLNVPSPTAPVSRLLSPRRSITACPRGLDLSVKPARVQLRPAIADDAELLPAIRRLCTTAKPDRHQAQSIRRLLSLRGRCGGVSGTVSERCLCRRDHANPGRQRLAAPARARGAEFPRWICRRPRVRLRVIGFGPSPRTGVYTATFIPRAAFGGRAIAKVRRRTKAPD